MATNSLESVLSHLPGLSDNQRRQLEQLFATWPPLPADASPEEQLEYRLAARGLLTRLPVRAARSSAAWSPLSIQGPPLSQTIIEERR